MQETQPGDMTTAATAVPTGRVQVTDTEELRVWAAGEGTPVVLIHGAFIWNVFQPLVDELVKTGGYQVIFYHRRGYNSKKTETSTFKDQAADVVKILDELGIKRAHIAGHSLGADIALEMAMQWPDRLLSATLLEPVMLVQIPSAKEFGEAMAPLAEKVQGGDIEGGSVDILAGIGCTEELMEGVAPGSWTQMLKDAPTFWAQEMPVWAEWQIDPTKVEGIKVPTALIHVDPSPQFKESAELFQKWNPDIKTLNVPGAEDHFFIVKAAANTARALDKWFKSSGVAA